MDFYDILDQVITLLKQRGRASYRALKIQFHLDDEALEALKDEVRADAGSRQLQAHYRGTEHIQPKTSVKLRKRLSGSNGAIMEGLP